jgi:hypothetical protein
MLMKCNSDKISIYKHAILIIHEVKNDVAVGTIQAYISNYDL